MSQLVVAVIAGILAGFLIADVVGRGRESWAIVAALRRSIMVWSFGGPRTVFRAFSRTTRARILH